VEVAIRGSVSAEKRAAVGSGVSVGGAVTLLFEDNSVRMNHAAQGHGGVGFVGTSATIRRNRFEGNTAGSYGGGLYLSPTSIDGGLLVENLFLRNHAGTRGGGLRLSGFQSIVRNNTFVKNSAGSGGACLGGGLSISTGDARVDVRRNIFAGSGGCAVECVSGRVTLVENLFWQNDSPGISGCGGPHTNVKDNLLDEDPLFCRPDWDVYTVAEGSPAIPRRIGAFLEPGCLEAVPAREPLGPTGSP